MPRNCQVRYKKTEGRLTVLRPPGCRALWRGCIWSRSASLRPELFCALEDSHVQDEEMSVVQAKIAGSFLYSLVFGSGGKDGGILSVVVG